MSHEQDDPTPGARPHPFVERRTPAGCAVQCDALVEIERRLAAVEGAFPDSLEKHHDYHLAKINSAKEEAEFWKTAKTELTKVGVSALVGVLKTLMVLAFLGLLYKLGLGSIAAAITAGGVVPK